MLLYAHVKRFCFRFLNKKHLIYNVQYHVNVTLINFRSFKDFFSGFGNEESFLKKLTGN